MSKPCYQYPGEPSQCIVIHRFNRFHSHARSTYLVLLTIAQPLLQDRTAKTVTGHLGHIPCKIRCEQSISKSKMKP